MSQKTKRPNANATNQQPSLIAFHVTERDDKSYWNRIGAVWPHKDGRGMTLQLDLVPAEGSRIVLRQPREKAGA